MRMTERTDDPVTADSGADSGPDLGGTDLGSTDSGGHGSGGADSGGAESGGRRSQGLLQPADAELPVRCVPDASVRRTIRRMDDPEILERVLAGLLDLA
jgi:hypothetical protein